MRFRPLTGGPTGPTGPASAKPLPAETARRHRPHRTRCWGGGVQVSVGSGWAIPWEGNLSGACKGCPWGSPGRPGTLPAARESMRWTPPGQPPHDIILVVARGTTWGVPRGVTTPTRSFQGGGAVRLPARGPSQWNQRPGEEEGTSGVLRRGGVRGGGGRRLGPRGT